MMSPKRLEEMKRLVTESTPFAVESSLVSDRLRHALRDAVAEIEELHKKINEMSDDDRRWYKLGAFVILEGENKP